MSKRGVGCTRTSGRAVGASEAEQSIQNQQTEKEETMVQAKVGGKAPDFQAPAYLKGEFTEVKLSDYLGKWIMLCFYPGDFTFV